MASVLAQVWVDVSGEEKGLALAPEMVPAHIFFLRVVHRYWEESGKVKRAQLLICSLLAVMMMLVLLDMCTEEEEHIHMKEGGRKLILGSCRGIGVGV